MKVLIAEDDSTSRMILAGIVENLGHEVIEATDGEEAWQAYLREDVPFALLDWVMPEMDGIDICRKVRAYEREHHDRDYTYIIMVTAKSTPEDLIAGMEAGADDFISKPYDSSVLAVRMKAGGRLLSAREEKKSRQELQEYVNHLLTFSAKLDLNGGILMLNDTFAKVVSSDYGSFVGRAFDECFCWSYEPGVQSRLKAAIKQVAAGKTVRYEDKMRVNGSSLITVDLSLSPVVGEDKKVRYIVAEARDISERKRAEEALQRAHDGLEVRVTERTAELAEANESLREEITERMQTEEKLQIALREKEELMKEIHHRVKNNLQIVSSLLDLQAMRIKDKNVTDALFDSRSRVHTMALIHTQLYQSESLEQVEMAATIRKLVEFLSQIYAKDNGKITTVVTAEDVILPISQAIPCGLLVNELVSNAFKYAFKGMAEGTVKIAMSELSGEQIELIIRDNGVGIPEELDIYKTKTLGLKLVRSLAESQLKGEMKLKRSEGTEFCIEFTKLIN